jgi:hypothetical protein
LIGCLLGVCVTGGVAQAQDYPPITDRSYGLDLYQGTAIGSSRVVAMGGATVAIGEGSAGMIYNPAAAAVRPATDNDRWSWDAHVDWLVPAPGTDHDNNGEAHTEIDDTLVLTAGILGQFKEWALGVGFVFEQHKVEIGPDEKADPTLMVLHLVLARSFWDEQLTLGLGLRAGQFSIGRIVGEDPSQVLFSISGTGLEVGAVWRPPDRSLRAGVTAALPVSGKQVSTDECDPMDCNGYILPERVEVPWQLAIGVGWRAAPTRWNIHIDDDWRDERSLVLTADLVITGASDDAYGIERFVDKQLQPSGRDLVVSARAGAEYEWIPGWLRVRAGSYWEPPRFDDVDGRLHVTGGLEVRLLSFCLFGDRHRAKASLTFDAAREYGNGGISVGLWH